MQQLLMLPPQQEKKMVKDIGDLMKKARDMQNGLKQAQKELLETEVVGESGGGLVKIIMNGRHDTIKVELDEAIKNEDISVIADLFAAANNDAVRKASKASQNKMSSIMGSMDLPKDFGLDESDQ